MITKLIQLSGRVNAAHKALNEAFRKEFPVGTRVEWYYRDVYLQIGTVEYCNPYGYLPPQMRVLNERTGKLVWVGLSEHPRRIK